MHTGTQEQLADTVVVTSPTCKSLDTVSPFDTFVTAEQIEFLTQKTRLQK